jgi:hypothetical protein
MMDFLIPTSSKASSEKILCSCLIVLLILSSKTYGSSVTGDRRKLNFHEGGVDDHDHEGADIEPNVALTRAPGIPPTFAPDPNQFINNNNMNGNGNDMQMRGPTEYYQERPPTMYPTGTDPNKNNYYPRMEPDLYYHYPPPIQYQYGPLPRDLPPTPYPTYVRPPTMYPTAGRPTPFPTYRMETPQPTPLPTPYPTNRPTDRPTPYPTPYRKLHLSLHLNGSYRTEIQTTIN